MFSIMQLTNTHTHTSKYATATYSPYYDFTMLELFHSFLATSYDKAWKDTFEVQK